jgi:DNA-binding transcriptional MerR regulator
MTTTEPELLRIGQAAEAAGVSTRTLRYYEQRGLLRPSGHSPGGERRYSAADIERLRTIRQLVDQLGTDLDTVRALLDAEDRLAGIRAEYRKPGQSPARQEQLLDEAESMNAALRAQVATRIAALAALQTYLEERAARYVAARDELGPRSE